MGYYLRTCANDFGYTLALRTEPAATSWVTNDSIPHPHASIDVAGNLITI